MSAGRVEVMWAAKGRIEGSLVPYYVAAGGGESVSATSEKFSEFHRATTSAFENEWHGKTSPGEGNQNMYSLGCVEYLKFCGEFGVIPGLPLNRGWSRGGLKKRKGGSEVWVRGFWWTDEASKVAMASTGFTALRGADAPTRRVLVLVPHSAGRVVLHVPSVCENICAVHGIAGEVDASQVGDQSYLDRISVRDGNTWHYEYGGEIRIFVFSSSPVHSIGLYVDVVDESHIAKQHLRFLGERKKYVSVRSRTGLATGLLELQSLFALYALLGHGTLHLYAGKVVADPFFLAGNGYVSNLGKCKDVFDVDGVRITSWEDFIEARKAGRVAKNQPDHLLCANYRYKPSEIMGAMSEAMEEHFRGTGFVRALALVYAVPVEMFRDENIVGFLRGVGGESFLGRESENAALFKFLTE